MPTTRTDTDHTSYACPKMRALHAQTVASINIVSMRTRAVETSDIRRCASLMRLIDVREGYMWQHAAAVSEAVCTCG